jgi:hypothetical protein
VRTQRQNRRRGAELVIVNRQVAARRNMRKIVSALCLASFGLLALNGGGQATRERTRVFRLDSMEGLEMVNTKADIVVYRGRKALHLAPRAES